MILYNITSKVHQAIDAAWMRWQRQEIIPAMMSTGLFSTHRIYRLLEQDDEEGYTYAVQFMLSSMSDYDKFLKLHSQSFSKRAHATWGARVVSFHSVMETVD